MNNDNFYDRFTINGEKLDFYRICLLYEITDPCLQHALKKLLRAGRSHKDIHTDVRNAIDTLSRWEELHPKEKGTWVVNTPTDVTIEGTSCLGCGGDRFFPRMSDERWVCASCGKISL